MHSPALAHATKWWLVTEARYNAAFLFLAGMAGAGLLPVLKFAANLRTGST